MPLFALVKGMAQLARIQTQKQIEAEVSEISELEADALKHEKFDLKESTDYLRHKAYDNALRDLERRKAFALATFRR